MGLHLPLRARKPLLAQRIGKQTNHQPSCSADWGTMASPMGPIVVDSDAPPSLGRLPEPQVRMNLFAAPSIRPIIDQLDAENR